MVSLIHRYSRWLHGRWPAGTVEKLPEVDGRYRSNVPGLYIVGDLTGIPLLKFSSNSGALAIADILADEDFQRQRAAGGPERVLDVVVVGAGGLRHGGGPGRARGRPGVRGPRGHGALLHGRQLSQGQADLHLPPGDDAGRRPAAHGRGQGAAGGRAPGADPRARHPAPHDAGGARGAVGRPLHRGHPRRRGPAGAPRRRRHRPLRELPPARRARGGPRQGLQPPARSQGFRRPGRARRRRRRQRHGDGHRRGHRWRTGDPVLPPARVLAPQAGERGAPRGPGRRPHGGRLGRHPVLGARDHVERTLPRGGAPPRIDQPHDVLQGARHRSARGGGLRCRGRGGAAAQRRGLHHDRPGGAAGVLPALGRGHPRRDGAARMGRLRPVHGPVRLRLQLEGRRLPDPLVPGKHLVSFQRSLPSEPDRRGPRRLGRGSGDPPRHPQPQSRRTRLLLQPALLRPRRPVRSKTHPPPAHPVRQGADLDAGRGAGGAAVPAALPPAALARVQRLVRQRLREELRRRPVPRRRLRPRPRVLARLRSRSRLAPVHLERVHLAAALVVAGHQPRADLRPHPADHLLLGQGGVLRLDLLLRRHGRDPGGHPPPQDAPRGRLEQDEHGGPGDPADLLPPAGDARRQLDLARHRSGAAASPASTPGCSTAGSRSAYS